MDVLRQVFSVLLVFSLLGAALWLLRRGGRISLQGLARKRVQGNTRSMVAVERLVVDAATHVAYRARQRARNPGRDASARLLRGHNGWQNRQWERRREKICSSHWRSLRRR